MSSTFLFYCKLESTSRPTYVTVWNQYSTINLCCCSGISAIVGVFINQTFWLNLGKSDNLDLCSGKMVKSASEKDYTDVVKHFSEEDVQTGLKLLNLSLIHISFNTYFF